MRPLARVLTVLVVAGASLLGPVATSTPPQQAQAADTRLFDAGNIISDAVFFDGRAMDAPAIQDFLRSKRSPSCPDPAADSSPCLSDFRMTTTDRAPDSLCAGYQGAAGESAARIIAKVAASCRVNPRVLLVLLQKEMGFVTSTNPTAKMYTRAAGYGCPDNGTGTCDPSYEGLQNQLYRSGWQYQKYAATPASYSYRAGRNNLIQWDVPRSCGTSTVYIQNQATAGLYNYTPYRPNQAALNAGYGLGDDCSAYGNRNFWLFFTDWFGSTQHATGGAVVARANAADTRGLIGSATSNVICGLRDDGCFQAFERGAIYWSPATGAQIVRGAIHERWADSGWETSRLGYPTSEEKCYLKDSGCFQEFQRGAMYWSPATGAQPVLGSIQEKWAATGWEAGPLGYPTGAEWCGLSAKGCVQKFQAGSIYWSSASGAHAMVPGVIQDRWRAAGADTGSLGFPTGDRMCLLKDGGCFQDFQKGAVYWSQATGAQPVVGAIRTKWNSTRWETGFLGYPTGAEWCRLSGGGCVQTFQGGSVYWSSTSGAHAMVPGVMWDLWRARGADTGSLGYPTGDQTCGLADGGCAQSFDQGTVYTSASAPPRTVSGAIRTKYAATRAHAGVLGYPSGDMVCGLRDSGCFQEFERGAIYSSAGAGAWTVLDGTIREAWAAQRWEQGPLGYPAGDQKCGSTGCSQQFTTGAVYRTQTGIRIVKGELYRAYTAANREQGPLGLPTGDAVCGLSRGGCSQQFQKGGIYWTSRTGAHRVTGKILEAWDAQGRELGSLGYPTSAPSVSARGITQRFQGGTLTQAAGTSTVTQR